MHLISFSAIPLHILSLSSYHSDLNFYFVSAKRVILRLCLTGSIQLSSSIRQLIIYYEAPLSAVLESLR